MEFGSKRAAPRRTGLGVGEEDVAGAGVAGRLHRALEATTIESRGFPRPRWSRYLPAHLPERLRERGRCGTPVSMIAGGVFGRGHRRAETPICEAVPWRSSIRLIPHPKWR
jgi:hypothetical protein